MTVDTAYFKAWTTQRLANRYPLWSRIRDRDDSVGQVFFNTIGVYLDQIYEELLKIRDNSYITRADLLEQPFVYTLWLPRSFEFTAVSTVHGRAKYEKPTVVGTADGTNINVVVSDELSMRSIDKSIVSPTRVDGTRLLASFNDIVIPRTTLSELSNKPINDDYIQYTGYLYIDIDNADQFGETLNNGIKVTPKVVVEGTPWNEDNTQEEHVIFRNNDERRTVNRWRELSLIESRGIYEGDTQILAHTGFNREFVREPLAFWESQDRETRLLYTFENSTYGVNILPVIQFRIPDILVADLQAQALSSQILEYEFVLMEDESTYMTDNVVGVERMPFTRTFVVATTNDLYFFSARIPHAFNYINDDSNGDNVISKTLRQRSAGAEIALSVDKNWMNYTEDDTSFTVHTRHTKVVRNISSTRLSVVYDSPALSSPVTKYYDWDGNVIAAASDAWLFNPVATDEWIDKKIAFDAASTTQHPAWVAVAKLEVEFSDGEIEIDSIVVHSDYRIADNKIALPAAIRGKVNGILFDARGRLLARTTDNELWEVGLYYDYCLVDYRKNRVLLLEDYDSVQVTS